MPWLSADDEARYVVAVRYFKRAFWDRDLLTADLVGEDLDAFELDAALLVEAATDAYAELRPWDEFQRACADLYAPYAWPRHETESMAPAEVRTLLTDDDRTQYDRIEQRLKAQLGTN